MCIQCNRQFKSKAALRSHKKDSPKHKTIPKVLPRVSSSITKAPAAGLNRREEIVTAPETVAGGSNIRENNNIEEPLAELEHQPLRLPHPLPRRRRRRRGPKTPVLKGDPDIDIGITAVDVLEDALVLPFIQTGPDETKPGNPVALVPTEHQVEGTKSESYELVVPKVPAPWSSIPLSERDVVLDALRAQCHSIEGLAEEGYWTQTPSPVDIDMTRQCSDCGGKEPPLTLK